MWRHIHPPSLLAREGDDALQISEETEFAIMWFREDKLRKWGSWTAFCSSNHNSPVTKQANKIILLSTSHLGLPITLLNITDSKLRLKPSHVNYLHESHQLLWIKNVTDKLILSLCFEVIWSVLKSSAFK